VSQGTVGEFDGPELRRNNFFLIEGVMGVDVGMSKDGGYGGFYAGVADGDFCFAGIADGGIYYGQDNLLFVERGGAF